MKIIIKLLIAALVASGTWRVGNAYLDYYRFKDAVTQLTQHRGNKTDAQIHDKIFELASDYNIPVTDENLTIARKDDHTIVDGAYKRPVMLLPGFEYQWPFTLHIDTFIVEPLKIDAR